MALKKKKKEEEEEEVEALANQIILNTTEIKLNEFQVHVNWEIFSIKYRILMFVCWSN